MAKLLTGTRIYGTGTVDTQLFVSGTEQATSTTTGALEVVGGVGIGGSLFVGGIVTATNLVRITDSTEASTTNTGALTVAGGLGVGKDLRVNGTIYGTVIGTIIGVTTTATNLANGTVGQVPFQEAQGVTKFFGPGTAGQLLVSAGASSTGPVYTNTSSIYVGRAGLADDLAGGGAGSIPYQDAANSTVFLGLGTAGFVMLAGTTAPVWVSTSTLVVGKAAQSDSILMTNNVVDTSVNYLTFVSTTTGYTSLRGAAMSGLVYRPSTGDLGIGTDNPLYKLHVSEPTDKIAARIDRSTSGDVLELYNGSGVTGGFTQLSFLHKDSATAAVAASKIVGYATSLAAGAVSGGLIFSSSNAGTISEAARFDNLGNFGLGNNNPIYKLDITGGVRMTGITTSTNATASTSPTTGALQLAGGAGVQGSVHVSGQFVSTQANNAANAGGQIYLNGATGNRIDFNANGIAAPAFTTRSAGTKIVYSPAISGSAVDYATGIETGSLWNSVPATTDSFKWYGATTLAASLSGAGLLTLSSDLATSAATFNLVDATATTVNFARAATAITIGSNVSGTTTVRNVLAVSTTTPTTTINDGALTVAGGVGIVGDLRIGGTFYGNVSVSGVITTATNIANGTTGQVPYQTAPGVTGFFGPGTAGNVLVSNGTGQPTYNNTLTLAGTTAATNTTSGALTVAGGVGVGKDIWVGGNIARTDGVYPSGSYHPLDITGKSTEGYVVGSFRSLNAGNQSLVSFQNPAQTGDIINIGSVGTSLVLQTNNTTRFTINNLGDVTISSTSATVSTTSGALQVAGGVGIAGDLVVGGGDIVTPVTTFNLIDATATTVNFARAATALTMGASTGITTVQNNLTVAGNLTVQGTTTQVNSTVTNVSDPIFTIGTGPLGADPTADDNRDRGIAFKWHNGTAARTGFFGFDDSTGFMTFVPTATLANEVVSGTKGAIDANLAGGTAQSIVYQSAANTTAYLAAGTAGYILQTNGTGSAPSWVATSGLSAGTSDAVKTVLQTGNASYFLTFVDSNNATATTENVYTTSSFVVNPSTGNVGIGTNLPQERIHATAAGPSYLQTQNTTAGYSAYFGVNTVGATVQSGGNQPITFWTFSTEKMRIDPAGNVGIGATPSHRLHIQAGAAVSTARGAGNTKFFFSADGSTVGTNYLELQTPATSSSDILFSRSSSAAYGLIRYDNATDSMALWTNTTERLRVSSAGDVGIGITAPTKRLQVESGATATGGQAWSHSAGTVYARLGVVSPGVSNDTEFGAVSNNSLRLITNNIERARITEAGVMLVNTTTVSTNGSLQVNGVIGLQGNSQIRQASNADGNTLQVFATQLVAAATNGGSYGYTGGGLIASVSPSASQILLDVGGQTAGHRLRVTNGGDGIQGRFAYSNYGVERFGVDSATGATVISTNTNATSVSSGALQVVGGTGIGGNLWVGGTANIATTLSGDVVSMGLAPERMIVNAGGGGKHIRSEAGDFSLRAASSTLGGLTIAAAGGTVTINSNTNATSTTTGALQVVGGVGIQGNLYVGGTIVGAVSGSSGSATTATNVGITNDNATTTDQYVTFVGASTGSAPVKVSATTGLLWKPNTVSLGIGVSPSLGKLHVSGKGYFSTEVQANAAIMNSASVNGTNSAVFGSNSAAVPVLINRNADPAGTDLYINASGDVSVGTYSASAKFGVSGPATATTVNSQSMVQRLISNTGNVDALEFSNVRGTAGSTWTTAGFRIQQKVDSTWMGYMQFNGTASGTNDGGISFGTGTTTTNANSVAERMRINPSGNVGVGTVAPTTRLTVQTSGANGIALLQDTGTTTNSGRLFFQASGGTFAETNVGNVLQWSSGATIGSDTGTARMVLNSSGFLGLGTTLAPLTYLDVRSGNTGTQAPQVSGITLRTSNGNGMEYHVQHANGYQGWVAAARVGANTSAWGSGFLEWITAGSSGGNQVSVMAMHGNGNVSIGSTAAPDYKLFVNGSFAATTKSFVIDHPTKAGHKLRYGSLEGPENGVYVRGRLKDNNIIELPDYWTGLVNEDSITVDLTPVGKHQLLYVADIADNTVTVGSETDHPINCFYTVWAERKDVDKLVVEYKEQEI
jgi:hypothetical protein